MKEWVPDEHAFLQGGALGECLNTIPFIETEVGQEPV